MVPLTQVMQIKGKVSQILISTVQIILDSMVPLTQVIIFQERVSRVPISTVQTTHDSMVPLQGHAK